MFLMPGMVIALYVMGELDTVLSSEHKKEMLRYLTNHQNSDGGYGIHIEGQKSYLFNGCVSGILYTDYSNLRTAVC